MANETTNLSDKIGVSATLELMAEEATELAFACLKLSRFLRDENPVVGKSGDELYSGLEEEVADVYVTLRELRKTPGLINSKNVSDIIDEKRKRMNKRLGMNAHSFIF